MSYSEKLQSPLWVSKRHWIIKRDNYSCQNINCNTTSITQNFKVKKIIRGDKEINIESDFFLTDEEKLELNVHHKFYITNKDPWEYEDEDLITLCPRCHKNEHQTKTIPVLNSNGDKLSDTTACSRCGGYGYIPKYEHVQDGICFRCWGEGIVIEQIDNIIKSR